MDVDCENTANEWRPTRHLPILPTGLPTVSIDIIRTITDTVNSEHLMDARN